MQWQACVIHHVYVVVGMCLPHRNYIYVVAGMCLSILCMQWLIEILISVWLACVLHPIHVMVGMPHINSIHVVVGVCLPPYTCSGQHRPFLYVPNGTSVFGVCFPHSVLFSIKRPIFFLHNISQKVSTYVLYVSFSIFFEILFHLLCQRFPVLNLKSFPKSFVANKIHVDG